MTVTIRFRSPRGLFRVLLCLAALGLPGWAAAAGRGEPGVVSVVRIELHGGRADLKALHELGIDVDGVFDGWARAYVLDDERRRLTESGFVLTPLLDEGKIGLARMAIEGIAGGPTETVPALYHTYATLTADLELIAAEHPDITRLVSAGESVQGRQLWFMKITDNPEVEEDEPETVYISSMHGDEVVGKELCFNLINYLTDNYGVVSEVTDLVNETEIWIMPSMNPDGTELGQRYNVNGVNLNRDFPDQWTDPVNTPAGRQPETAAVMAWGAAHSSTLSANYHGGALVVNYPLDGNESGASIFSPAPDPDQAAFLSMSRTYADLNPPMFNNSGGSFDHGVTNGAAWYMIRGGMQDWSYFWRGNFEVTIEVSNVKWPAASTLPQFWAENLASMLAYFGRAHGGVRGLVTDAVSAEPVAAAIRIDANPYPTHTDPDVGDYHRILEPGAYTMEVSAAGYAPQTLPVTATSAPAARYDVALLPLATDLHPVDSRVEDGAGGDGWLDPGETADLAVTLTNLGGAAAGVSARLEPTGWFATVSRLDATYPDIPPAGVGESDAPHYQVAVDGSIPPGHKVGFALRWVSAGASGVSEPFFLDVGAPVSVTAGDVPQAIVDFATTTSLLDVATVTNIDAPRIPVTISHTYIGDLILELTSPSGTTVVLHNRAGGSADDIVGTYGVDLTPAEPLSALDGEPAAGTWTLAISDKAGGDTGTLHAWGVEIDGRPPETSTPGMRFHDIEAGPGGVVLRWWPYPGLTSYRVYRATDPTVTANFVDVTAEDGDDTDTSFQDGSTAPLVFYLVTGVGPLGEGPLR